MSITAESLKKKPVKILFHSELKALPHLDGYELQELLGVGGMGIVYRGIQEGLNRPVAIKILQHHQRHQNNQVRFLEEGRAIARLQHPGIIQVFDSGEQGDLTFLVMELIEGGNLQQLLIQGALPVRQAAQLVLKLALAVEHAHQAGILHRDLKPANVLLNPQPASELHNTQDSAHRVLNPKITDFGLARQLDHSVRLTVSGQFVGTPQYMAPEQIRGETHVRQAADIYGLGAILYECLTGQPPFEGKKELEIGWKILQQEPVPPQRIRSEIPTDLQTICLKCLAKEPAGRYNSAKALADDLARFLDNVPVLARPLTIMQRTWLWSKRNPLVAGLVMAIFLTLFLGLISSSYFWWRADEANRQLRTEYLLSHWIEMGRVHRNNKNFEQALEYFQKARAFYEQELQRQPVTAPMLSGLAGCWEAEARVALQSKNPQLAVEKLLIAIEIQRKAHQMLPASNLYVMFLDQHLLLLADAYQMLNDWEMVLGAVRDRRQLQVQQTEHDVILAEQAAWLLDTTAIPPSYRSELLEMAFGSLEQARQKGLLTPEIQRRSCWKSLHADTRWSVLLERIQPVSPGR